MFSYIIYKQVSIKNITLIYQNLKFNKSYIWNSNNKLSYFKNKLINKINKKKYKNKLIFYKLKNYKIN